MKSFTVGKEQKLSAFLLDSYNGALNYGAFMKLLRKKDVKINGARVNKDVTVYLGDKIDCYYDGEVTFTLAEVYKDDNILILDKPKNITSEDFEVLVKKTYPTANLCHRLDRNTDGILCFSLNDDSYEELLTAFKERTVKKYYLAEVYGVFENKSDTLTAYLLKNSIESNVKIFNKKVDGAVKIITKYKTLKSSGGTSLIEVELVTGKTHQIRAHLAYAGHFIIGDGKYGNVKINSTYKAKSQRLTAYKIEFELKGKLEYLYGREFKLSRSVYGVN